MIPTPAIEAVAGLTAPLSALPGPVNGAAAMAPAAAPSANWLSGVLGDVNAQVVTAEQGVEQFALADTGSLHAVMLNMEQARLSFQFIVQVRNKLLDAYQDLTRMQI